MAWAQAPRNAQEYNSRGLERQRNGDLDGAIDDFTKAIESSEGLLQAPGYINRANARMDKSDWDGAIGDYTRRQDFEKAFKLDPGLRAQYKDFIEKWRAKTKP